MSASIARLQRAVEAALEIDRARPGHDVAHAVGEDRVRQDGRGARAVADHVAGLLGGLAQHLRAEILLRILEVEFLGDGHAVVADDRRAPFLLDQHRFRLRAERDAHRIRQLRRAAQDLLARGRAKQDLLVCHGLQHEAENRAGIDLFQSNASKRPLDSGCGRADDPERVKCGPGLTGL